MSPVTKRLGNWLPVLIALAVPLVFLPSLVDSFILPRSALVVTGACLGTGLAVLIPGKPRLGALKWPLLAAAGAALVASAFSVSWPTSLIGSYTRYESLPVRLSYLGLAAVPVWLLRTELARVALVAVVIFGVSVSCGEAIAQWALNVPFRPDGNLGNASLLGALVAMALPLTLDRMLRAGWAAPFWFVAGAVQVAGLVVTTSRAGALGAFAGCVALAVFSLRGRAAAAAGAIATALVAVGLILIVFSPLRALNADPGATRLRLYPDALHMVLARPITGWGEDATGLVFGRFLTGDWSPGVTFDRAHSGPLDLGATQGVLGLIALGWVLFVLGRGVWKWRFPPAPDAARSPPGGPLRLGALGAALAGYTVWVLFNFDWAPATGMFWLLAGTAWSSVRARGSAGESPLEAPAPWTTAFQAGRAATAIGLVAVAIAFGVLPVLAEAWYSQGRADLAVRADPLQSQYHRALGEEMIGQGSRQEGLSELQLAAKLGSSDPALYVEIGDEELRNGDTAGSRAAYRMALTVDPYWGPAQRRLSGTGGLGSA